MPVFAEGEPCWVDALLPDVEAGKRFYGPLFGWTFGDHLPEHHGYTFALRDGVPAGALAAKPDGRMPTVWNLYLATVDAAACAGKIRDAGGEVFMGPQRVGDLGTMLMAADPTGAVFGVWQGGGHPGFGTGGGPGAFCWAELLTRAPETTDPFYREVFGVRGEQIGESGGDFDYEVWSAAGDPEHRPLAGRMRMGSDVPRELPPHFGVVFAVGDCDAAADAARAGGGRVASDPRDTPYGRLAELVDDQGAHFTVLDRSRATR